MGHPIAFAAQIPITFLITRDRKNAQPFYRDTLGLPLFKDDGFVAVLDPASVPLRLTEVPVHNPSAHPVLGWQVNDIVATATALREQGVVFTIEDGMGPDDLAIWTAPDGKAKVAFVIDPDGNGLSSTQN